MQKPGSSCPEMRTAVEAAPAARPLGEREGMTVTPYPVFPGITLVYRDIHAVSQEEEGAGDARVLEIRHCFEGRMEYTFGDATYCLAPGDLSVSEIAACPRETRFPTGHFHGVSVLIDIDRAPGCLSCLLEDVDVEPRALAEKFCHGGNVYVSHSSPRVEHIFSELYGVPQELRKGYFKVKVLELLLFLSSLSPESDESAAHRVTKTQVDLAERIAQYLDGNMDEKVTLGQLQKKFGASGAQIRNCFRQVFGISAAAYIRREKMKRAAKALTDTDRTVLDIALEYGYDNASKFAKTFRTVMGASPAAYRSGAWQNTYAPADARRADA